MATSVAWALTICLLFSPWPGLHGPDSWPQVSPGPWPFAYCFRLGLGYTAWILGYKCRLGPRNLFTVGALAWVTRPEFLANSAAWTLANFQNNLLFIFSAHLAGRFSVNNDASQTYLSLDFFRASGDAILDAQRHFSKQFLLRFFSRLRRCDFDT